MTKNLKRSLVKAVSILCASGIIIAALLSRAPGSFSQTYPQGALIHISKNTSLTQAADLLYEKGLIRSPFLFKAQIVISSGKKGIKAGDYLFTKPTDLFTVASRLIKGDQGLVPVKITIPEGTTAADMAFIFLKNIPGFDAPYFIKEAQGKEGYLFPDTYYFLPNVTPDEVIDALRKNFDQKIESLSSDISVSKRSLSQIVIMASILEEEARTPETRRIISGILWKRLDEGMLLQVDAPLTYITADTTGYTSIKDTQIDSPYNTYKYKGLPKGPISNPGLDAIMAALHPTETPYYYYLSDKNGMMHYAKTFEEHQVNREKYLGK